MGGLGHDGSSLREQAKNARDPRRAKRQLKRLPKWRGKDAGSIGDIFAPQIDFPWDRKVYARAPLAASYMDSLSARDRTAVFHALFPRMSAIAERAWTDAAHRTYQVAGVRYPFRAPHRPETISATRGWFLVWLWDALEGIDADLEWISAWTPHLEDGRAHPNAIAWLLGTALRAGGPDAAMVRDVLTRSINGDHEVGQMGRHAIVALLNSNARDDWELIGNLLLTAQRQEGLRQAILEASDEASPEAFRYVLGLVLEHDLHRFSSTVRAFDIWLGMQWAGGSTSVVRDELTRLCRFFDDDRSREEAITSGPPEEAFLALWATAYVDAGAAVALASRMLDADAPEHRFVALRLITMTRFQPEGLDLIAARLQRGEPDDRLRMALVGALGGFQFERASDGLFTTVAEIFHATPEKARVLPHIVWPWARYALERSVPAGALRAMAKGSPEKMIPFVGALDNAICSTVVREIAGLVLQPHKDGYRIVQHKPMTREARALMLRLVKDSRQDVQSAAFEALSTVPLESDEAELLVGQLHRSSAIFRKGALKRLTTLPEPDLLATAERLLSNSSSKARAAGLELADHLATHSHKHGAAARALVTGAQIGDSELRLAAERIASGAPARSISCDDALGLVPKGSRAKPITPIHRGVRLETPAAHRCIEQLANIVIQHAETEIQVPGGDLGSEAVSTVLLGSGGWRFPRPAGNANIETQARERMPLFDIWNTWLNQRARTERDPDGLEIVRAAAWLGRDEQHCEALPPIFSEAGHWSLRHALTAILRWLVLLSNPNSAGALLTQLLEDALAQPTPTPEEHRFLTRKEPGERRERHPERYVVSVRLRCATDGWQKGEWEYSQADSARLGALTMLAMDRQYPGCESGPSLARFVAAFDAGYLNEYDLIWHLLYVRGEMNADPYGLSQTVRLGPIAEVSTYRSCKHLEGRPALLEAVRKVRERIIEIEIARGEKPTLVSIAAKSLGYAGGAEVLFRLAGALGRDKIIRQHEWGEPTRAFSLSRLISVTGPGESDTHERFAELHRTSGIKRSRTLELAMFAPQWAAHAEHALGFPGLEDAIWWVHAHTKNRDYWRGELRDIWASRISERTELDADDLEEGAVDVAWFRRVMNAIGTDGWNAIQPAVKYASNSGGHKRAELFAESMLGRVVVPDLMPRIDGPRHQESVRALGLIPLPPDPEHAQAEALRRYTRLQNFRRESRQFGSMRQASEGRAVDIGLQNLARTAGFRDPRRLQWAMESHAVADLAQGPVVVTAEETTVALSIDDEGAPSLAVTKKGKSLKDIPAAAKKSPAISDLRSRVTELRRQVSRMRSSLEDSMCRGDSFIPAELRSLLAHPMLRPMLERLVFIGEGTLIGYPDAHSNTLRDHAGRVEPIGTSDSMRIAHPMDFLSRGDWTEWQRDCFVAERVQPFKQVFREAYAKTAGELDRSDMSRRYAGHQINPRQALALLKTRQWIFAPEEGVKKTFHDEKIVADVWFQEYFHTPAEVEGLTLEGVAFARRGSERKRLMLAEVPDRVFSEAMRDMDLVVSVAHIGGIDPEASASTVEMRRTLVHQTCRVLNLANVRVEGHHAIIDGVRATYSVHLGSATTRIMPATMLVIVAVHSQHRGRLFLPFADDDPKSAEVLTKVLLLARDTEIKDPSILEQIRR